MTSPFSSSAFRALWVAATISYVGTFVQEIAERWLILELTGTPAPSATLAAVFTTGSLVAILPAGVLADRLPRRSLVIFSQVAQAAVAAAIGVLVVTKIVTPNALLMGAAAAGLAMGIGTPAMSALVSDILPAELVAEGVVMNAVSFNIARAVGPAVGGMIVDAFGPSTSFFLNASSFLVVAVALATVRIERPRPSQPPPPMTKALVESVRYSARDAELRAVFVAMVLFTGGAVFVHALTPAFAKLTLRADPRAYGLFFAAMGIGAILAATVLRRVRDRMPPRMFLALMMLVFAVAAAAAARTPHVAIAIALYVPLGIGWTGTFSPLNALLQLWAPNRLRGRVIALYWVIHLGSYALLALAAGHLAEILDVRGALLVGAGLAGLAALVTTKLPLPDSYAGPQREMPVGPSTR